MLGSCCFLCLGKPEDNFKKTQIRYSEANKEKRETFKKDLAKLEQKHPEKSVFYADETGIDKYIYRSNVRAKKGVKVYSKIRGKSTKEFLLSQENAVIKSLRRLLTRELQTAPFSNIGLKIVFVLKLPKI